MAPAVCLQLLVWTVPLILISIISHRLHCLHFIKLVIVFDLFDNVKSILKFYMKIHAKVWDGTQISDNIQTDVHAHRFLSTTHTINNQIIIQRIHILLFRLGCPCLQCCVRIAELFKGFSLQDPFQIYSQHLKIPSESTLTSKGVHPRFFIDWGDKGHLKKILRVFL